MASPEEMTSLLPEMLPADFSDWDGEESPTAGPVGEWEARLAARSSGKNPKPPGQSAERAAISPPVVEKLRASGSAPSAAVSIDQQMLKSELVNGPPSRASRTPASRLTADEAPAQLRRLNAATADGTRNSSARTATMKPEAEKALYAPFASKKGAIAEEQKTPGNPAKSKWMAVGAAGACSILLPLLLIARFHPGAKVVAKQSVGPLPATSNIELRTDAPEPSAGEPLNQVEPPATTERQEIADRQPASDERGANSTKVRAEMMHDQLIAPTRIPQGAKKPVTVDEPPPANLGVAVLAGLGGSAANNRIFDGHRRPVVAPAPFKPITISSGVAVGMLIETTPPVYPPIAKVARVSGTVELQAIISKSGMIRDLHVVSGPPMLQQAAVDAVQTWRYRPYKLNNQPVEIETTIDVNFVLER